MKRKILASVLCALAIGFSACDDDDDDAIISTSPEKAIAGKSFEGLYQVIDGKTGDTTYVSGSVSFASTDTAYVCKVTAELKGETSSMQFTSTVLANVVQTSNGFSFYLYPDEVDSSNPPMGDAGFSGLIENEGGCILSFVRSIRNGRKVYATNFTFSDTAFNLKQ